MGLIIASNGSVRVPRSGERIDKGQLYNLELDEKLGFQFNPEQIQWEQELRWAERSSIGRDTGGSKFFLNSGSRRLELNLLFMAEPGAPSIDYYVQPPIQMRTEFGAELDFVVAVLERWKKKIPDKGRPGVLAFVVGEANPNNMKCVIRRMGVRIIDQFPDGLSTREGMITLELIEWTDQI